MNLFRKIFRIEMILVFAGMMSVSYAQGWEWRNPTPHGITINDILMLNENRAIAVCENGYVMNSWDGGRTWHTNAVTSMNFYSVAAAADGTLLISTDNQTILRSTDQGITWNIQYKGNTGANLDLSEIAVVDDSTVLAKLSSDYLAQSTDNGATWKRLTLPFPWPESLNAIAVQSPLNWRLVSSKYVYATNDAGKSWIKDTTYQARGLIRLFFADSLYAYQLREGQLLQTKDGGATWKEMNIYGFDSNIRIAAGKQFGNTVYCLSDGNYIINKSTDGGNTWNVSLTGAAFTESVPTSMSFASSNIGLVAGEGGRILRTEDGGLAWTIVHGIGFLGSISDLVFMSPTQGIALSYSPTILTTSNGGKRWDESIPHPDYSLRKVTMLNPKEGFAVAAAYASTAKPAVFSTTNSGRSWTFLAELPITTVVYKVVQPQSICAASRDTVYIGATWSVCYRTTNGGLTWDSLYISQLGNAQSTGIRIFAFPPQRVVYVSSRAIAISENGGDTWTCHNSPLGTYISNVQFFSPIEATGLLSGQAAKTTDAGKSWKVQGSEKLDLLWFFNANNAIGWKYQYDSLKRSCIARSYDGGINWTYHTLRERVNWTDWFFISEDEGWAYGVGGMIRHTKNGGIVSVDRGGMPATTFSIAECYPNPFSLSSHHAATISFTLPEGNRRNVTISLFDMLGRRIANVLDSELGGGTHYAVFQPAQSEFSLPAGLYVFRLTVGDEIFTRKLMIVK